ncbi:glycoside hydrolase family 30 protein [Calocera cornea HHB12733]|uniref:Glycoside hydrolase family 30 protein n=1 Tax=Calocera cornea HHB12733 TaxID=1353952 RepID=A0A165CKL5_9BASI|nr:glycoside hydrolase family 30 protein [Calocera cornea HHB12733]
MLSTRLCLGFALFGSTLAQQIWDIRVEWETAYDQSVLFERQTPSTLPINFVTPGPIASADISVDDAVLLQPIDGFGAALTDSAAYTLSQLKITNSANYWSLLNTLFETTDGAATAALTFLRIPLGASDFSPSVYSYNDQNDTSLSEFSIDVAPSYLWSTLSDIQSIGGAQLKIIISPWSAPGWMTSTGTMLGGTFLPQYVDTLAQYLLMSVQQIYDKGFYIYAVSIQVRPRAFILLPASDNQLQNEPENSNPTYPTMLLDPDTEAAVATQLRTLLDDAGFGTVQIFAWEHNWDQAANYPVQALNDDASAFAGASFHCYNGAVQDQLYFYDAYPAKGIWFTECTGEFGSVWWSDVKWNMQNLMIGSPQYYGRSVVLWNLALDGAGNPKLPGTDSCGGPGCRGVVTVNSDGSYELNQEYYTLAQASRAVVPKDPGGPFGQRINSTVSGDLGYELVVGAYKTGRSEEADTDWNRYALVVMNWDDGETSGTASAVETTIEFRGMQATYTFPVGVTTLWWFAEN